MAQLTIKRTQVNVKKNRFGMALGYFLVASLFFAAIIMHHVVSAPVVMSYVALFGIFGMVCLVASVKSH